DHMCHIYLFLNKSHHFLGMHLGDILKSSTHNNCNQCTLEIRDLGRYKMTKKYKVVEMHYWSKNIGDDTIDISTITFIYFPLYLTAHLLILNILTEASATIEEISQPNLNNGSPGDLLQSKRRDDMFIFETVRIILFFMKINAQISCTFIHTK
ncbi:hypothetical protein ACJX0J_036854, partial [Zea mays]